MITAGMAEFYGALLGDGCLSCYYENASKRQRHCVQLTGHTHDREYYERILRPVIREYFGINGYLYQCKNRPFVRYNIMSKKVFDFFVDLGFPEFKLNAGTLIQQIQIILVNYGIKTTKICRDNASFVLRITHQSSVHIFMTLINTRHEYHKERYLKNHHYHS